MKNSYISAAALAAALTLSISHAQSADMIIDNPETGFQWSGFYIGGGVGAGAVNHEFSIAGGSFDGLGGEGVYGELSLGYDYMLTDRFLLGGFISARMGMVETTLSIPTVADTTATLDHGFDAGVRAGYLITPETLGYVLAGYSYQNLDISVPPLAFSTDEDFSGFVVGFGLETAITNRLTAKVEYNYRQYGGEDFGTGGAFSIEPSTHTVLLGLNYRFGGSADAPVATFAAPAANWTGFYISGSAGAAGLVHELSSPLAPGISLNGIGAEGLVGSLGIGYDHDFGNVVAGIQLRGRVSSVSTDLNFGGLSGSIDETYGVDVIGRLGYKFTDAAMIYGLAGYSHAKFDLSTNVTGSITKPDSSGFVIGAGIETAITDHVFAGVEYRYADYSKIDVLGLGAINVEPSSHSGELTLKYKF
ncbi:MAG: hypothetical protein CME90_07865 [Hoeflea sp.]|nr:hypothetical protein [Hoeflea sp.]|tara:strand:- start:17817 stop:19070 length:1254 start_codon:yes stop_codon:yes gene_type:complete